MRNSMAFLVGLALLVSACGGQAPVSQTSSPTATASAAPTKPARAKITVAVGSAASLIYLPWDLAKALNYFEDENIEVDLQYQSGGTPAANALLSGSVDFSGNSLDHSIRAQLQQKPTKMIVSFARLPGVALVMRADQKDKIKTFADFRGKTVGATSVGSGTHILLTYLLKTQGGLDPDKDYKFAPVGSSTMAAALDKGDVVAAMNSDPFVTAYVNAGKGVIFADLRREDETAKLLGGVYQFTGAVTRTDVLQSKPDVVQRVVNALVRANRFIAANSAKDIAAKLPKTVTGEDVDLYVKALEAGKGYLSKDGVTDKIGVQTVIKINTVFGQAYPQQALFTDASKIDVDALFDNSYAQKVR
jgi:NitT/TauT family transport system substrate-binding protein